MPSQTLYRKYRPQTFGQVRAQERVTKTLLNALAAGRIGHAYLFTGPRGVGKTSIARLLAKAVNCLHTDDTRPDGTHPVEPDNSCAICQQIAEGRCLDVIEIDAASNGRVDDARDLRDQINYSPNEARYKFYIIDEAHQITKDAFDALLKTFEEPPEHVIFVLATTDPSKVPATILSRCQRFDLRRHSMADLRAGLAAVCAQENVAAEAGALDLLARAAEGSSRDSLSLLDQAIAFCGRTIPEAGVRTMLGMASAETIDRLAQALVARDAQAGLGVINDAVDAGIEPRGLNRELVEHLRYLLLMKVNGAAATTIDQPAEELELLGRELGDVQLDQLVRQIRIFSQADAAFRFAAQGQLPLELAFLDAIHLSATPTAAQPAPTVLPLAASSPPPRAAAPPPRPAQSPPPRPLPPVDDGGALPEEAEPTASSSPPERDSEQTENDAIMPAMGPSAADEEFQGILERWPRVLEVVRQQDRTVEALLRSCAPQGLSGSTLTLLCDAQFHAKTLEQPDKKRLVEGAISRVAGRPCYVTCVVRGKKAPAAESAEGAQRPPEDDPLVRAALRMLNARVLD